MKIYTRSGDEGKTSVIGGHVDKDDVRVEAYGTIDELNCAVGQAIQLTGGEDWSDLRDHLLQIQHELFDCGSDLAYKTLVQEKLKVHSSMVDQLEKWMDRYELENPELLRFILPGGTELAASLHWCRGVCRRAERRTVSLARQEEINPQVIRYLNRLSDFFFTVARTANAREGVSDIEYTRSADVFGKS